MTVDYLIPALKQHCDRALKELKLPKQPPTDSGTVAAVKPSIYEYALPAKTGTGTGTPDRLAPYLMLEVGSRENGRDEDGQMFATATVRIYGVTWGPDRADAEKSLCVLFERLITHFIRFPAAGDQYLIHPDMGFVPYHEANTHYSAGELDISLDVPPVYPDFDFINGFNPPID